MTIKHHPDISSLMSCAAGSQPEVFAAVMASHLAVCPHCVREVSDLGRIGEALLDSIAPALLEWPAPLAAVRSLQAADAPSSRSSLGAASASSEVPAALSAFIGAELDGIAWRRLGPGLWHYPLPLSKAAKGDLRLFKVAAGQKLPDHGHGGEEMTLVLRGSYSDATGHYGVGDVAEMDDEIEHAPVADALHGCICLIASEKPARFKGLLARMMQPLVGL